MDRDKARREKDHGYELPTPQVVSLDLKADPVKAKTKPVEADAETVEEAVDVDAEAVEAEAEATDADADVDAEPVEAEAEAEAVDTDADADEADAEPIGADAEPVDSDAKATEAKVEDARVAEAASDARPVKAQSGPQTARDDRPASQAPGKVAAAAAATARAARTRRPGERLGWLEDQLEVRDDLIVRLVPGWAPGGAGIPAEEAIVAALDTLAAERSQEIKAAELARKQSKEAHGKGMEAGALAAVVGLGLFASAVALGYAIWENMIR